MSKEPSIVNTFYHRLLTPAELAKILPITERTLENWRLDGKGPPFVHLGAGAHNKVVYSWSAVEEWLDRHRVEQNARPR